MLRLVDQRRPIAWATMRFFSQRYRTTYEARGLEDWERIVLRRAVYVPALKLLYTVNAKAASSSLRDMMFTLGGGSRAAGPGQGLYFPTPRWREVMTALRDPEVFKFTVGRHPVGRAVSAFHNLFVDRKNGFNWRHGIYLRRSGLRYGEATTANFDRFLDYVEEVQAESALFCDAHLRLQTHNTGARHVSYDRIGHYESLVEDVRSITTAAGVTSYTDATLGWVNRSGQVAGAVEPTPAQISRIQAIYAEDYERFGYARG